MQILDDEKEFYAKITEQINMVLKNGKVVLTRFLTLREQEIINSLVKNKNLCIQFYGGYENAERQRCLLSSEQLTDSDRIFNISCYKINYNKRYLNLTHREVLGTLMSLNIDRSLFGDIVFDKGDCFFFVSSEVEVILLQEFVMISRVPVSLTLYDEPINIELKYDSKEIIVSSMRLDAVISHVYHISRDLAQKLFANNSVYKNFQPTDNQAVMCEESDIISVRGYGRFIIAKILRNTKSNKIVLEIQTPAI